jgi:predicted RNA binding protein with dsRBD fold (UPF0201 family)
MPAVGSRISSEVMPHADGVRVREALTNVLQSAPFRNTQQCQNFLKYIVEHTLAGESKGTIQTALANLKSPY